MAVFSFVFKTATSNWQPTPRSHGLCQEVLTVHGLYIYGQRLTAFLRVTFNSEKFAETRKVVSSKLINEWHQVQTIISTNFVFIRHNPPCIKKSLPVPPVGKKFVQEELGKIYTCPAHGPATYQPHLYNTQIVSVCSVTKIIFVIYEIRRHCKIEKNASRREHLFGMPRNAHFFSICLFWRWYCEQKY